MFIAAAAGGIYDHIKEKKLRKRMRNQELSLDSHTNIALNLEVELEALFEVFSKLDKVKLPKLKKD